MLQGQVVEAVGFPAVENFLPVLEDADFKKTGEFKSGLQPQDVTVTELQKGMHHAEYIALKGTLVDRLARGLGQTANGPVFRTTLVLQNSNFLFEAEKDTTDENNYLVGGWTRAAEKFNLVNALSVAGQQIANGAGMQIQLETSGQLQTLPKTRPKVT